MGRDSGLLCGGEAIRDGCLLGLEGLLPFATVRGIEIEVESYFLGQAGESKQ